MADVATKKSINVVSTKKNEVCSVQSNNGLIDLDNITASNNQLISLCENNDDDDDLVLTNNSRNGLETDDKSLQELIESELALRICSGNEDEVVVVAESNEEGTAQSEPIKKIILDQKQDVLDVNTEFIVAESEHYSLIEEPYQNGHSSPASRTIDRDNVEPRPVDFRDEEEREVFADEPETDGATTIQQKVTDEKFNEDKEEEIQERLQDTSDDLVELADQDERTSLTTRDSIQPHHICSSKYEEEEEAASKVTDEAEESIPLADDRLRDNEDSDRTSADLLDTWPEQTSIVDGHLANQFSDNFDEASLTREFARTSNQMTDSKSDNFEVRVVEGASEVSELEETGYSDVFFRDDVSSMEKHSPLDTTAATDLVEDDLRCTSSPVRSRTFDDGISTASEISAEAASTQEFIDIERRVLGGELDLTPGIVESASTQEIDQNLSPEVEESTPSAGTEGSAQLEDNNRMEANPTVHSEETKYESADKQTYDSWITVEEATNEDNPRIETTETTNEKLDEINDKLDESLLSASPRAPLATPDDETSDMSNTCDSESREETITTTSVTSTAVKNGTKTKKKKIEGVTGNDASPNLTPKSKKTKKSKKNDLEKENISVNSNLRDPSMHTGSRQMHPEMIDFSDEDDLSNVNVKSLTQNYVSEASRTERERSRKERIATGVSIKQLCRSFGDISNMSDGDQATFEKTNHSANNGEKTRSMGDLRLCEEGYAKFTKDAFVFTGVSVKALRASYCSLASLTGAGKDKEQGCERWRFEKSSFNKFDALSKKTVLHVRSVDAAKVQQQLNAVGQNGDTNPNCRSCGKVVFQMEQTKAEGLVWHKNCFRCVQCSKQLNVDNYESHESTLYCKAHFKELFQPKPVEESDQPVRPRKPEMIIRENEPKELPPDVVRASDKPDLGLEELSSLNVKSRFQVFEKACTDNSNEIERSPSQVAVKRSPSILSKLAKFQAKGMDIGVADESLNGIPFEESSESEEEEEIEETEEETEIVKSKRTTRERPISFTKMDDIKNRWESTSQQGRRETQREARKEEIAGIRSRLFMGKQGKMKEMYQQAVAGSERVTKINAAEEIQHTTNARSIKERFERGEPIAASDDETDSKPKPEKADEEVIAAGISRKSRSLFLELDASAAKTGRPVTPVNPPKTPADVPRRARDAFMGRQVSDDVVRSTDTTEEVHVETSDITNKFKFFETYREPEKQRKQFRITPPRDGQVKMDSPEREIYRDPGVVRADDRVDDVVHTDTARKMLSIFRQMEENATKEDLPDGPKPLKRFTPPPEDKFAKQTASDSEEEDEEEGEESEGEESGEEKDPNYVRASDKVEDEFLKQAQNAARAKTLRAKFEHWEETDSSKVSNHHHIAEMEIAQGTGEQSSIESASSLRARFESLGSQSNDSPRTPKVKVNRFVEIQATCTDVCESCQKKVYPLEKVETNNKIFHKQCFRCLQCNCVLRMDTFTLNNGKLYCIPHFKQLFITRGNYDEGFGVDPHKNKWASTNTNNAASPPPIAVSNGDS